MAVWCKSRCTVCGRCGWCVDKRSCRQPRSLPFVGDCVLTSPHWPVCIPVLRCCPLLHTYKQIWQVYDRCCARVRCTCLWEVINQLAQCADESFWTELRLLLCVVGHLACCAHVVVLCLSAVFLPAVLLLWSLWSAVCSVVGCCCRVPSVLVWQPSPQLSMGFCTGRRAGFSMHV